MYMNVIKYVFIFLVTGVSAQTPTSLTVQKDLRVQGKTVLGGVSKIQDLTIYADTIRMSGLDGTGTFLTIDGSGDVIKGTVGAAGVTGKEDRWKEKRKETRGKERIFFNSNKNKNCSG